LVLNSKTMMAKSVHCNKALEFEIDIGNPFIFIIKTY
jgi:hypothetical protein